MTEPLMDSPTSEDFTDIQDQENLEISDRYRSHLDQRGKRNNFSPSYLNTRPRDVLEKYSITPEQEEQILYLYASTYSLHQTASSCGIPLDKVRAVVYAPQSHELIQELRATMKISVLQKIEEAQVVLLDAMQDPDKLKDTPLTSISEVFTDISGTQLNLISSLREQHSSISEVDPAEAFTGEELEYMMMLRRRLSMGSKPALPEPDLDAPLDPWETDFSVTGEAAGPGDPDPDEDDFDEYDLGDA